MYATTVRFPGPRVAAERARLCLRRHRLEVDRLEDRVLLATGLVAAYNFNEGSGTTVGDASGDGNFGAISNAT